MKRSGAPLSLLSSSSLLSSPLSSLSLSFSRVVQVGSYLRDPEDGYLLVRWVDVDLMCWCVS
jgi:hypothetical protein